MLWILIGFAVVAGLAVCAAGFIWLVITVAGDHDRTEATRDLY